MQPNLFSFERERLRLSCLLKLVEAPVSTRRIRSLAENVVRSNNQLSNDRSKGVELLWAALKKIEC
jgi:hypothetical protein